MKEISTLREYVEYKRSKHRCMTADEMRIVGLKWPQSHGWIKKHGNIYISPVMLERLHESYAQWEERKRQKQAIGQLDSRSARKKARKELQKARRAAWKHHMHEAAKSIPREPAKEIKQPPPKVRMAGVDPRSNEFLQTYEWRTVRMMALELYGPVCQCCGASPKTGAVINVDHVKPRKLYPELALEVSNLQILCHECNHGKGNWSQTDWRDINEKDAVLDYLDRKSRR